MLLVTIEKFKVNPMLVDVNKLKNYKYMESEIQKQEQHMPIYWEQNASGVQVKFLIRGRMMKTMKYRNHE